jgi:site-specific DNA recombinase
MAQVITLQPRTPQGPTRPLRAVLYLRVSTLEQAATDYDEDGYSLHAQRDACRRAAERLNAEVVEEYVDRGKSARSADRPELQRMLRRIRQSRDVDYVIVHKVDRLARSRADDIQIVLALRQSGTTLVSATENIDETPSGTLLHAIMAAVAEFYSGNLAQEARKGMKKKAEFGGTPGNSPVGYKNVRDRIDGRDVGIVVVDPERAEHIRWAFRTFARGHHTLKQLTDELTDRGFTMPATARFPERPIRVSGVHKMLHNRYYLGLVTFDGVEYPGRHEALVDEPTFALVDALLASRSASKEKPQIRPHPLKGVLHCGRCGRRLGLTRVTGHGGDYLYFFCLGRQSDPGSCSQGYVGAERVEAAVAEHWAAFKRSDAERTELRAAVLGILQAQGADAQREVAEQQARLTAIRRRQQKAKEAYYNDALTIEDFKQEQQRHNREAAAAETIIQRHLASLSAIEDGLDDLLRLLQDPVAFYEAAADNIKRMLVQEAFERIWVVDERVVGTDLTRPFAELLAVEAQLAARAAIAGSAKDQLTYERREMSVSGMVDLEARRRAQAQEKLAYLRDTTNLRHEAAGGSNIVQLVGVTGFEPATSSSRTKHATKLRHTPRTTGPA